MSRFENRLTSKSLHPSTIEKYNSIIESAGDSDLLKWIERKVNHRSPLGTLLPIRAAVKHYLISEQGYTSDELETLLPEAVGVDPQFRDALDIHQLGIFHAAVERCPEPTKTILTLLPMTGMSISEACNLQRSQIDLRTNQLVLQKGRRVPLSKAALTVFERYPLPGDGPVFVTSNYGSTITPHGVRIHTRSIAKANPEIGNLSPMVLRHTYAKMTLNDGASLERLRQLLGHKSIQTTRRYLEG